MTKKKSERDALKRRMTRESVGIYTIALTLHCVCITRVFMQHVYVYSYEATKKKELNLV
jgi:hypothetical protein